MAARTATSAAWMRAAAVHAQLLVGGQLEPVRLPAEIDARLGRDPGEFPVGHFVGGLRFARCYPMTVQYHRPRMVAFGSPQFVAGAVAGSFVLDGALRRRARRLAANQWRDVRLDRVVLTTRRLWCLVEDEGPRWLHVGYDSIRSLALDGTAMTLALAGGEPLRLTGDEAPWCAAVIAHYRYGAGAADVLPQLNARIAG